MMLKAQTLKSGTEQSSHFYRCPGCSEMVDGRQLSEVLIHHRHVLDAYRLSISRGFEAARAKPSVKRRRTADRH
jgi:hypothetical protein